METAHAYGLRKTLRRWTESMASLRIVANVACLSSEERSSRILQRAFGKNGFNVLLLQHDIYLVWKELVWSFFPGSGGR